MNTTNNFFIGIYKKMSYKINPVKAAVMAHKGGYCDINNLNETCFNVCAAFKGSENNWDISPQCADQCEGLVEKMRLETYGLDWCDHHAPRRPVNWNQAPHFFPALFNQCKNVPKALAQCLQKCEGQNLCGECKNNCKVDSYAVDQTGTRENYSDDDNNNNNDDNNGSPDFGKYEKAHPVAFWIGVSLATLVFLFFIFVLFRFLMQKKR
jgi:hypothetical protein